jgi:hypothetical protein
MIKSNLPALFDPILFWGAIFVILFSYLRGFAPSRERRTLSAVRHCQCVISREGAKKEQDTHGDPSTF